MAATGMTVKGLRELRRAFKAMGDKDFEKHLRRANVKVATLVLNEARPGIAAQSSRVASDATVVNSAARSRLKFGNARAGGVIFGSVSNRPRIGPSGRRYLGHNQFRSWHAGPYHVYDEADRVINGPAGDEYIKDINTYLDAQGVPRG